MTLAPAEIPFNFVNINLAVLINMNFIYELFKFVVICHEPACRDAGL